MCLIVWRHGKEKVLGSFYQNISELAIGAGLHPSTFPWWHVHSCPWSSELDELLSRLGPWRIADQGNKGRVCFEGLWPSFSDDVGMCEQFLFFRLCTKVWWDPTDSHTQLNCQRASAGQGWESADGMVSAMVPMIPGRPGWSITQVENQEGMGGGRERERGRESLHWEAQKPPPAPCCPLWGVLWVTCWGCCWRSSAPVTGCADTLLDLLTYFAQCIVGHDTVKETFLGTLFHLELLMIVSCCGVVLGQTLPLGIFKLSLSWHSHDPGLPQVFVVCSECAVAFGSRWFLNIAQLITIWKARQDPSGTLLS